MIESAQAHLDWLIALVRDLLPPGETFTIDTTPLSPTSVLYAIHPASSQGRGILIGRSGETVNALRRIFTVRLSSHHAGWTPTIQIALERNPNVQESRHLTTSN